MMKKLILLLLFIPLVSFGQNDFIGSVERNNVTTYLETKNNGMISTCGYVENNCADDCFIGIHINNISLL